MTANGVGRWKAWATGGYYVAQNDDLRTLEEEVSSLMDQGWVPTGGVAVVHRTWENDRKGWTESATTFYQAMTRPAHA
ncbi:hypothetical protein [Longimicrobium sp.]|jgi:hypothetical protein|uniref:hypothetical protein n=1 Tax=Longimicrobium sp. TaxID=2029185 RepID=UPI002F92DA0E